MISRKAVHIFAVIAAITTVILIISTIVLIGFNP